MYRIYALYLTDKVCCEPLTPQLHFSDLRDGQPAYMQYLGSVLEALAVSLDRLAILYKVSV